MRKNMLGVRISQSTETQLLELENLEKENELKFNFKAKTKAELIEEAIEFYYLQRMDAKKGHPYFNFFETQTRALFDNYIKQINYLWKDLHYQNIKNSELLLLFYKLLDINVSEKIIDNVIDEKLYAEEKVDEKILNLIKKNGEK